MHFIKKRMPSKILEHHAQPSTDIEHTSVNGMLHQTVEESGNDFEGFIDLVDHNRIIGWAYNRAKPTRRLVIEVLSGDMRVVVIANLDRPDLQKAGKGDGRYGFDAKFDASAIGTEAIYIREISTLWNLSGSPVRFDLIQLLGSPLNQSRSDLIRAEAQITLLKLKGLA